MGERIPLIGGESSAAEFALDPSKRAQVVQFVQDTPSVTGRQVAAHVYSLFSASPQAPLADIDVDTLVAAVDKIRQAFANTTTQPTPTSPIALKSISVELGIDAKGTVGFIVGGSLDVSGKITVTFDRDSS